MLPSLVTSTDEKTIFVTSGIIKDDEKIHITAKPKCIKNKSVSSGARNNYKTEMTGDSHCRGLRIILNTTFTAGGLSSPIFVVINGLSLEEMPYNEIVTVPVYGLIPGSDRDIYNSTKKGYITFVRGVENK